MLLLNPSPIMLHACWFQRMPIQPGQEGKLPIIVLLDPELYVLASRHVQWRLVGCLLTCDIGEAKACQFKGQHTIASAHVQY